jgi:hypothetical protein
MIFKCVYCTEEFNDRKPIDIDGRLFCTRNCKDRYFALKRKPKFKSIRSV